MITSLKNLFYSKKYSNGKFNLLLIGAQKSGTSSLHKLLGNHPDIFMTKTIKEPGYFLPFEVMKPYFKSKGIKFKTKEQFKRLLFRGYRGEKVIGESSTFYTSKEWSNIETVHRIYKYNPKIKLIYIVRDQEERIISHYKHELKKNKRLKFKNFLNNEEAFGISCYYKRLEPFIDSFGLSNVLILDFDDLITNPNLIMKRITDFLRINPLKIDAVPRENVSINLDSKYELEFKKLLRNHSNYRNLVADMLNFEALLKN